MPVMAKVLKTVAQIKQSPFLKDQDAALHHIAVSHGLKKTAGPDPNGAKENQQPNFSFIITRPTVLVRDGPSSRKLAASRSVSALNKSTRTCAFCKQL